MLSLFGHQSKHIELDISIYITVPDYFQVINLYLELLKERELSEPNKFVKCHFFNTFFYKKVHYYVQ
jgi:hypothetical protein